MGQLKIGRGSALQNQELAEVAGPDNTERHEDHYHWAGEVGRLQAFPGLWEQGSQSAKGPGC